MILFTGAIHLPDCALTSGSLLIEGDRIAAIENGIMDAPAGATRIDDPHSLILPGFIDVHVHGVEGIDVLDGPGAVAKVAARLPRYGVTAFCPTTVGLPFSMILIAAALTNISDDLYEAAELDGAGPVRRLWHITLPSIAPALLAVACLVLIASLRAFDVIFALTQGGPVDSTNVLPLLSYQASFQEFQFGRGAAIGSFSFLIVFTVALVYVRTLRLENAA